MEANNAKIAVLPNVSKDIDELVYEAALEREFAKEDALERKMAAVENRATHRRKRLLESSEKFLEEQKDYLIRIEAEKDARVKDIETDFDRQIAEKNAQLNDLLRRTKDISTAINLLQQERATRRKEVVGQYEKDIDNQNAIIAAQASAIAILKDKG